jgi:hypothetical protein
MGWLFFHKPKGKKAVDAILDSMCPDPEYRAKKIVATSATREAVFVVVRTDKANDVYVPDADGTARALMVFKIQSRPKDQYNFGYKDMDETMGPYGCPAPMSIIAQCSELQDPIGPYPRWSSLKSTREYREASAKAAATKALKRGLKPGNKVTLAKPGKWGGIECQRFTVERARLRGRKGISTVFRAENGMLCGVSARLLEGATVEA